MSKIQLASLAEITLQALDFFIKTPPRRLRLAARSFPLVVGSGNAYHTAQVIFAKRRALVANESTFAQVVSTYRPLIRNKTITEAIIISASGSKDSVWEIDLAKQVGLKTILLTCQKDSPAAQLADQVILYKKIPEPYTYNVSTYLGMILSSTQEDPRFIKKYLKSLRLPDFKKYRAFTFILPDHLSAVAPMLTIKRDELFGSQLSLRAFSFGEARHAKFVNPNKHELVISWGTNQHFGLPENRYLLKLPAQAQAGLVMALSYYLIGKIQESKPPYFQRNIANYVKSGPQAYGQKKPFPLVVD